jgi:CheY-like chemotaxis protein
MKDNNCPDLAGAGMPKGRFSKLSILIADTSPYTGNIIASMLRTLGIHDIREVNDGRAALTELALRSFDVMMIDEPLAEIDGVEVTRRLRKTEGAVNRLMPVIMMASAPDVAAIAAARDAGVTEFLRKPFAGSHIESRLIAIEAQPRGFIEASAYVGPDRRRRRAGFGGGERRGGHE